MIEDVVKRVSKARDARAGDAGSESLAGAAKPALDDEIGIGRIMSAIEDGDFSDSELAMLRKQWQSTPKSPNPRPPHPPPGHTRPARRGQETRKGSRREERETNRFHPVGTALITKTY